MLKMVSPVTAIVGDAGKSDPRNRKIIGYGWHHTAGGSWETNKEVMNTTRRGVSCNTLISRSKIGLVTKFSDRAHTTGAPNDGGKGAVLDHMSLTSEVVNDVGDPYWDFNDETYASCALMAAFAFITYGVPLRRALFYGDAGHWTHGGANAAWGAGYATACPGSLSVERILKEAAVVVAQLLTGSTIGENMDHIELVRNSSNGEMYILNRVTGRSVHIKNDKEVEMFVNLGIIVIAKQKNLPNWEFFRYIETFEKLGFGN